MTELPAPYRTQLDESIAAVFERAAVVHANSIALATGTSGLTYDALNRAANRLAHAILAKCTERERPIAFVADAGTAPYVCLLAIAKAGNAYVALDPSQPVAQLRAVCAEIEPALVLASSRRVPLAAQLSSVAGAVLDIDALDATLPDHNPALSISPSRSAAIFFTTGTTGQPKGVYYDQRSLLHRIFTTILCTDIRAGDRQALYILCDRTWSATVLFSTLLAGATLCPLEINEVGVPLLAQWATRERITHFPMTSSLFRQWLDVLPRADEWDCAALRFLSVGAEPLLRHDVERFGRQFSPDCTLFHSLAMTECGRISYSKIRRDTPLPDARAPAGHADVDKEILIARDDGRWAAPGETGEIAVRTHYMMSGYWRKPRSSAAVIRPDPDGSDKRVFFTGDIGRIRDDGQLEVLGRRDLQLKVRGYRVQPSEIEQRLLDLGSIDEAVVVALDEPDGDKRLVAYLVARGALQPSISELRAALAQTLAGHMIPSAFVFVPAFPLTPNGKVNRLALPKPTRDRPQVSNTYVPPRTALEAQLARIWEDVLQIAPVGMDDDFFELGGDSLGVSRVVAGAMRLGVRLSPRKLYDGASIGGIAAAVAAERHSSNPEDLTRP